jgi:hypothetical protein
MRAAPGMGLAALLSAAGLVESWRAMASIRIRVLRLTLTSVLCVILLGQSAAFAWHIFGVRPKEGRTGAVFHVDLVEACRRLGPRLGEFDAVYFTTAEFNLPYIVAACALPLDPKRWHEEPREFTERQNWLYYTRVGKLYFLYDCAPAEKLAGLRMRGPAGRYAFVVRPAELPDVAPSEVIRSAHGEARLHVVIVEIQAGS